MTSYLTVARDGSTETEVRRSRFIAHVKRVSTEKDARAFVESVRRQHWDARHNCSAFVLGPTGDVARSNDDGEPAGTAGAPMLEALRGAAVTDVVAVVTRYFGGILLGAGGLVRAYGGAVRAVLDEVGLLERRLCTVWELTLDHAEAGRIENDLRSRGVQVRDVTYGDRVTLRLATQGLDLDVLVHELTAGDSSPVRAGEEWVDASRNSLGR